MLFLYYWVSNENFHGSMSQDFFLPLCHAISSFMLEWINLHMIRWEVIFAWWEKSALETSLGMGTVAVLSGEWKGAQWNSVFYCYLLCCTHWQGAVGLGKAAPCMSRLLSPFRGGFTPNLAVMPLPFLSLGPQRPSKQWQPPQGTVVRQTLASCEGFCESY